MLAQQVTEQHNRALTYAIHAEGRSDPFAYRRALTHMRNGVGWRATKPEDKAQPYTLGYCYGHNSRA